MYSSTPSTQASAQTSPRNSYYQCHKVPLYYQIWCHIHVLILHYPLVEFNMVEQLSFFWLCLLACRTLILQLGIEPRPQQWNCRFLTTGLPGNSNLHLSYLNIGLKISTTLDVLSQSLFLVLPLWPWLLNIGESQDCLMSLLFFC